MMRHTLIPLLILLPVLPGCGKPDARSTFPTGTFVDDYSIRYQITDTAWTQDPGSSYRIERVLPEEQVLFLLQPATDSTSARWTRVEWMVFEDMAPWTWGFCYAAWDEPGIEEAQAAPPVDRSDPRSGCGGFPFSRMKPLP